MLNLYCCLVLWVLTLLINVIPADQSTPEHACCNTEDTKRYDRSTHLRTSKGKVDRRRKLPADEKESFLPNTIFQLGISAKIQGFSNIGQCMMTVKYKSFPKECKCGSPKKRCVQINIPRTDVRRLMPNCMVVDRCDGLCPPRSVCYPKASEKITVQVIAVVNPNPFADFRYECLSVELESHTSCGCSCIVTEKDCNYNQKYDPSECRCECKHYIECDKNIQIWDPTTCSCVCREHIPQICSSGSFFDEINCRCAQENEIN